MSTSTTVDQPMSRHDVWLTVAFAVAKDGLPEPKNLSLHDDIVSMSLDTPAQVTAWGDWLGTGQADKPHWMAKLDLWHYGWHASRSEHRTGWAWQIRADVPEVPWPAPPSPLAEQVMAAIETPAPALAVA